LCKLFQLHNLGLDFGSNRAAKQEKAAEFDPGGPQNIGNEVFVRTKEEAPADSGASLLIYL
jgi:hypothetical protein